MKNGPESAAAAQRATGGTAPVKSAPEGAPAQAGDEFVNRKLIRPTRTDGSGAAVAPAPERRERPLAKRSMAPDQTHAENFYFQKQMQAGTVLTIVLKNGETVQGTIDWYDKNCIKLSRGVRGSLLLYKQAIRYLHKTGE